MPLTISEESGTATDLTLNKYRQDEETLKNVRPEGGEAEVSNAQRPWDTALLLLSPTLDPGPQRGCGQHRFPMHPVSQELCSPPCYSQLERTSGALSPLQPPRDGGKGTLLCCR